MRKIIVAALIFACVCVVADDKKVVPHNNKIKIKDKAILRLLPDLILATVRLTHTSQGWVVSGHVYNCGYKSTDIRSVEVQIVGYKWDWKNKRHYQVFKQIIHVPLSQKFGPNYYKMFSTKLNKKLIPGRDGGYIKFHVDPNNRVKEQNDGNNIAHEFLKPVE